MQNNTKITKTAKYCKSGRGKLQIHIMHIAYCISHRSQDKTLATILAELNYKGIDFNLDYRCTLVRNFLRNIILVAKSRQWSDNDGLKAFPLKVVGKRDDAR